MDPRSKIKYGLGCLIVDCFLILETVIDMYTGKLTPTELFLQIVLCAIFTVPIIVLLKRFARKDSRKFSSKDAEAQDDMDDIQEL